MDQSNTIFTQYMASVATSRQIILTALTLLAQQETNIDRIMNNIQRTNTEPVQIWQSFTRPVNNTNIQREHLNNTFVELLTEALINQTNRRRPVDGTLLTATQIRNATETMLFSELPTNPNIENYYSCPISYENFVDESEITRLRYCGHYFCRDSIMRWLAINTHCPMCRYDLRNDQTTNSLDSNTPIPNDNSLNNILGEMISNFDEQNETFVFHIDFEPTTNEE